VDTALSSDLQEVQQGTTSPRHMSLHMTSPYSVHCGMNVIAKTKGMHCSTARMCLLLLAS
jgi:hypothetical protein